MAEFGGVGGESVTRKKADRLIRLFTFISTFIYRQLRHVGHGRCLVICCSPRTAEGDRGLVCFADRWRWPVMRMAGGVSLVAFRYCVLPLVLLLQEVGRQRFF
jgi:hypothetical protein